MIARFVPSNATDLADSRHLVRGDGIFNVTDRAYGATGDGSTDDAAAIQAAIDAAYAYGAGTVYVPPGVYVIGTTLTLKYRVNLVGVGTTYNEGTTTIGSVLKMKAATNSHILAFDQVNGPTRGSLGQRWQNSLVKGIYFDGNRANQSSAGYCLDVENIWGIDIVNCCVRNAYVSNMYALNVNEMHISNSFFVSATTGDCVNWTDVRDSSIDSTCQIGGGANPLAMRYSSVGCNYNSISGFFFNGQTGSGIIIPSALSVGNRLVNVRCDQNFQHGIYCKGQYTAMAGIECHMNGWDNSGQVVGGIYLDGTDVTVTGAVCFDGGASGNQDYGVIVSADANKVFVTGSFGGNLTDAYLNLSAGSVVIMDSSSAFATLDNALNQFAAPVADVAMNSHKLTGLSAGVSSGESVRYEQIFSNSALIHALFPWIVDLQYFTPTASATWTKPASGTMVFILAIGAGGGGGGGTKGASSIYGGAGGGSGTRTGVWLPLAALSASSYTVQVGAGGAGGTGASSGTAGTGADGSRATIFDTSGVLVSVPVGAGGAGGGTVSPAGGAGGGAATTNAPTGYVMNVSTSQGGAGGGSSITTVGSNGTASTGAGGGASGITSGAASSGSGGAGSISNAVTANSAPAGTTSNRGGVGGGFYGFPPNTWAAQGGAGGASSGAATESQGGFGMFGGGGGGSGSRVTAGTAPAGGAGGDGALIVIVF